MAWYNDVTSPESAAAVALGNPGAKSGVGGAANRVGLSDDPDNYSGKPGAWWSQITGQAGAQDKANDLANSQQQGMTQQMGYSNQMNDVAQANVNKMAGITNTYTQGIQGLLGKED